MDCRGCSFDLFCPSVCSDLRLSLRCRYIVNEANSFSNRTKSCFNKTGMAIVDSVRDLRDFSVGVMRICGR